MWEDAENLDSFNRSTILTCISAPESRFQQQRHADQALTNLFFVFTDPNGTLRSNDMLELLSAFRPLFSLPDTRWEHERDDIVHHSTIPDQMRDTQIVAVLDLARQAYEGHGETLDAMVDAYERSQSMNKRRLIRQHPTS